MKEYYILKTRNLTGAQAPLAPLWIRHWRDTATEVTRVRVSTKNSLIVKRAVPSWKSTRIRNSVLTSQQVP